MGCDSPIEAKEEGISENETKYENRQKENNMSSTLVMRKAPEFTMEAFDAKSGHYTTVKSEDYMRTIKVNGMSSVFTLPTLHLYAPQRSLL